MTATDRFRARGLRLLRGGPVDARAGAVPGLLPGSLGYINLPAAPVISVATVLCAPLGVAIAHPLNARRLRLAFALFLGTSAVKMLSETFL